MPDFLENELAKIEKEFIKRIQMIGKLPKSEQIKIIAQADLIQEMEAAGLTKLVNKMKVNYIDIIQELAGKKLQGVSPATLNQLEKVIQLDTNQILRSGHQYADRLQSALIKEMSTGKAISSVNFSIPGFQPNWEIAAVQTSEASFRSGVTAGVFEDEPEQKFILVGPLDDKTRDTCQAALGSPDNVEGWTIEEIDSGEVSAIAGDSYTWAFRGGFNCRHDWQPVFDID